MKGSLRNALVSKGSKLKRVVGASLTVGLVMAATGAHAAIDVTGGEASIADANTAISAIGTGLLGLAGVAMAYRWAKATFF